MIIVEPIEFGEPSISGGGGSCYDRTGVLQTAPPNTLRVTYDPSDLSKAPYALIEPEATNFLSHSEDFTQAAWGKNGATPVANSGFAPNGSNSATLLVEGSATGAYLTQGKVVTAGEIVTLSVFAKSFSPDRGLALIFTGGDAVGVNQIMGFDLDTHQASSISGGLAWHVEPLANGWARYFIEFVTLGAGGVSTQIRIVKNNGITYAGDGASAILIFGAMLSGGRSSYIKTGNTPVTRAADVIGAGAGLVFSNVPIVETAYDIKATYAKDARVYDPATYEAFQSLVAGNVGKALDDTSAWSPRGAINRRAMFDKYNNTQTVMPDEILVVLTPEMVAQGLYLGNLDVHELRISMVDALDGVVYSEVISLIESNSQSSYFNWMFKRIKRRTYFFVLDLPVYANALVTISLRKIGAEAKAGMCAIGPVEEFGPSLLGLSTEGKDFSSTTFNFDGTSKTTLRPYAKRMSCDVVVPNDEITYVQERLFELRQRPLVWVGGPYGATAVFGRYGSFKNVIEYQMQSKMNLMIEGAV